MFELKSKSALIIGTDDEGATIAAAVEDAGRGERYWGCTNAQQDEEEDESVPNAAAAHPTNALRAVKGRWDVVVVIVVRRSESM